MRDRVANLPFLSEGPGMVVCNAPSRTSKGLEHEMGIWEHRRLVGMR